ncbi:MAG TPA: hypothetical protein VF297_03275 [Pyrinomonadaceae bacterium]
MLTAPDPDEDERAEDDQGHGDGVTDDLDGRGRLPRKQHREHRRDRAAEHDD